MCRVLGVSTSGYYAWCDRAPSAHALADAVLTERIRQVHAESHHTYGMPRVRAKLIDQGVTVSRTRVARLMRSHGIRGISRRRGFTVTTRSSRHDAKAPDLVQRKFEADGPNQLWVADMTYVPTWAGFIFLAVVLDAWSRRVVGWAVGETMAAELVLGALNMALQQRRPEDVIHHSDQGSQYASIAFGGRCKKMGVRPSVGGVGDAYDNAMAESFFASLECELIGRKSWQTKTEARLALFTWIEDSPLSMRPFTTRSIRTSSTTTGARMPLDTSPLSATLPGTWELLSRTDVDDAGEPQSEPSLGADPIALLIYDRAGHFSAQFMKRDRSAAAVVDVSTAGSNNTRAQGGYDAYFGRYTVDDATRTVTQRLVGALSIESVGVEVTREMRVDDDRLVISLRTTSLTGKPVTRSLTWKRVG